MGKRQSSIAWLDAFNDSPFKGNPAAVCFLEEKRDGQWLQAVAREFNVSETCYLTRHTDHESKIGDYSHSTIYPRFRLRWFTPGAEVKLCGHATLAASHYLFTSGLVNANTVEFLTLSGVLTAKRVPDAEKSDSLNFQIREGKECFRIELAFPMVPTVEFNCNELSAISKTLGSVSVMEIKKTAEEDHLLEG